MRFVHPIGPSFGGKTTAARSGPGLVMAGPDAVALLKRLDVGDLLVGRVSKVLNDSHVLMDFQGVELVAKANVPMPEGAEIKGEVQAKGPPLVLKIVDDSLADKSHVFLRFRSLAAQLMPATEDHPLIAFLKTQGIGESDWVRPLTRWLTAFALGEANPIHAHPVWEALVNSGIFFERKLRQWVEDGGRDSFQEIEVDLKGIALRLLAEMEGRGKGEGFVFDRATRILESLIGRIELFQTANWLAQEQGLGFIFQIPLRLGDKLWTADLFVGPPQKKCGDKAGLRVLLLLDLGGFGRFQIDTHISRKGVGTTIGVDREAVLVLLRSMEEELKQGLERHGLTVVGIECVLLEKFVTVGDLFRPLLVMDEVEGLNIRV